MAGTSTGVYEFNSVVRGHHVYKIVWTPTIDETLQVIREDASDHDEYAVAIVKDECIVGHVPREISRICSFFKTRNYYMQNHRPQKERSWAGSTMCLHLRRLS